MTTEVTFNVESVILLFQTSPYSQKGPSLIPVSFLFLSPAISTKKEPEQSPHMIHFPPSLPYCQYLVWMSE